MVIIYNGFKPGERRATKHKVRAIDQGHSVVESATRRAGDDFRFHWSVTCQCGKVYKSRTGIDRAYRSHGEHLNKFIGKVY